MHVLQVIACICPRSSGGLVSQVHCFFGMSMPWACHTCHLHDNADVNDKLWLNAVLNAGDSTPSELEPLTIETNDSDKDSQS